MSAPRSVRACVIAVARAVISSVRLDAFAASAPVARVISDAIADELTPSAAAARVASAVTCD